MEHPSKAMSMQWTLISSLISSDKSVFRAASSVMLWISYQLSGCWKDRMSAVSPEMNRIGLIKYIFGNMQKK
jgi:hypothetical protein